MQNPFVVPLSIVVAGIIVAVAVFYVEKQPKPQTVHNELDTVSVKVPLVQDSDHIRGKPSAPVIIIEYSDTECPYCKEYHQALKQIISEFGPTGQVAWVYRHFPIKELHSKAPHEAEALECAGELGGEEMFWKYTDKIFEITPSNDGLEETELYTTAQDIGLNGTDFAACLTSGKYRQKIAQSVEDALRAGGTGTPLSVILYQGDEFILQGAQTYEYMKSLLNIMIEPGSATQISTTTATTTP